MGTPGDSILVAPVCPLGTMSNVTLCHRGVKDNCLLPRDSALWPGSPSLLSRAMGEWLSGFNWAWWATVTFRSDFTLNSARRAVRNFFLMVEDAAGHPVGGFWAIERHKYRGGDDPASLVPHFHALVADVAGVSRRAVWEKCHRRWGRTRIEPYDPTRGASQYVSKYCAKETFEQGEWGVWRPEVVQAAGCPLQVGI